MAEPGQDPAKPVDRENTNRDHPGHAGEPRSFARDAPVAPSPAEGRLGPAGDPAEGKRDEA